MTFDVPVLLLIFNRPDTTERVINQIKAVRPSKLFIAADGPRVHNVKDKQMCEAVRSLVLNTIDWDCELKTLFREQNLGCGIAVSEAITWFFENVDEGIILEDDILVDPSFFSFCRAMLIKYRHDTRIMHVSGSTFVYPFIRINNPYYFSKLPSVWGWASWKRAWIEYRYNVNELDEKIIRSEIEQWAGNSKISNYYLNIFSKMKAREFDTWDYQWLLTIFASGGLVITPSVNLALNIGFESDPTHTNSKVAMLYQHLKLQELTSFESDVDVKVNLKIDRYSMKKYLGISNNIFLRAFRFAKRQLQSKK
jgi:hypothetical protein